MKKRASILSIIVLAILFSLPCYGTSAELPKPTNAFFVNDFAGVLDSKTEQALQNIAVQLQQKTTAQVVVVTIDSLQEASLELYAYELYKAWGIGTAEKNNGVLILVAVHDRKSRIEVGYGLEGALPDGKTGRIQDNYMIPYFKEGDYASGITNGFLAIVQEVYGEYGIDIESLDHGDSLTVTQPEPGRGRGDSENNGPIVIFAIIVLMIDWIFLRGRITRFLFIAFMSSGRVAAWRRRWIRRRLWRRRRRRRRRLRWRCRSGGGGSSRSW